jgi:hypothetical protein
VSLRFSGFPRDTDDPSKAIGLETLISVLKSTFESSPFNFKGPITFILRAILSRPKDVRKEAIVYTNQAYKKFKIQFVSAKQRFEESGETEVSLPIEYVTKQDYNPQERIGEEMRGTCSMSNVKSVLEAKLPPSASQKPLELWDKIKVPPYATKLITEVPTISTVSFSDAEIRKRVEIGLSKTLKLPKIEAFLRSNTDGTAFLALLNRILDILTIEGFDIEVLKSYREIAVYLETNSLTRDAARGVLDELLALLDKNKNRARFLQALLKASQKDLVMNMILLNKEDAERTNNMIRARERDVFKQRLRQMNDTEREITKMLLDIGIAPYLITNEDREIFAKEFRVEDPEQTYADKEKEEDEDRPEEGYNAFRDVQENGDDRRNDAGQQLESDYGFYGDRVEQRYDREYDNIANYDTNEGYGV